mmetsp:Transcript_20270/g.29433  ORF Transcript_20270/g.29433 Transcript_20270/m.29433 type:complete len:159 (-) Transcript_20270:1006-1482(-)|eukprot:CAMPEP_0184738020 /NCGR_PEP_ID=MMETSP0315-20130426/765_1 /TAXON_ID=101924 /ORGANISM="Rhodosorus marinus, Strain UTEX LB 2760" /LENGTH=158 /DNA_ID=CAMNT_0027205551 /DNA_START=82 /DNA_END=558 /DNA_ORIENTATION=+
MDLYWFDILMASEDGLDPIFDQTEAEELKQLFYSVGKDAAPGLGLPCDSGEGSKKSERRGGAPATKAKRKLCSCRYCEKEFTQSGHRNEHECRFHLDIGYRCDVCEKIFGVKSKLDRHIRNVHGNARNYKCWCGKDFKEKYYLSRHLKAHDKKRSPPP